MKHNIIALAVLQATAALAQAAPKTQGGITKPRYDKRPKAGPISGRHDLNLASLDDKRPIHIGKPQSDEICIGGGSSDMKMAIPTLWRSAASARAKQPVSGMHLASV